MGLAQNRVKISYQYCEYLAKKRTTYSFPIQIIWDLRTSGCSCPIHQASQSVLSGDESPNYNALSVQLRKSYLIGIENLTQADS